jgi:type I restriction enzyme M protein
MNTLTTKYHPYDFATKDDVAVCFPRKPWRLSTIVFVQLMMAREKWRYSYYRKCFMGKLRRQSVVLPAKGVNVDEDTIETIMESTTYWAALKPRLA